MRFVARFGCIVALASAAPAGSIVNFDGVSEAAIRDELAQLPQMRPGQYETMIDYLRPALIAKMFRSKESRLSSYCLTDAAAARSPRDHLDDLDIEGDCSFDRFDVDGETVDAQMQCSTIPSGGTLTMTMTGTMGSEASTLHITTLVEGGALPSNMTTIEMRIVTRRTGECTAASRATAEEERRRRDGE